MLTNFHYFLEYLVRKSFKSYLKLWRNNDDDNFWSCKKIWLGMEKGIFMIKEILKISFYLRLFILTFKECVTKYHFCNLFNLIKTRYITYKSQMCLESNHIISISYFQYILIAITWWFTNYHKKNSFLKNVYKLSPCVQPSVKCFLFPVFRLKSSC